MTRHGRAGLPAGRSVRWARSCWPSSTRLTRRDAGESRMTTPTGRTHAACPGDVRRYPRARSGHRSLHGRPEAARRRPHRSRNGTSPRPLQRITRNQRPAHITHLPPIPSHTITLHLPRGIPTTLLITLAITVTEDITVHLRIIRLLYHHLRHALVITSDPLRRIPASRNHERHRPQSCHEARHPIVFEALAETRPGMPGCWYPVVRIR